jgi:hypothetical protein
MLYRCIGVFTKQQIKEMGSRPLGHPIDELYAGPVWEIGGVILSVDGPLKWIMRDRLSPPETEIGIYVVSYLSSRFDKKKFKKDE